MSEQTLNAIWAVTIANLIASFSLMPLFGWWLADHVHSANLAIPIIVAAVVSYSSVVFLVALLVQGMRK